MRPFSTNLDRTNIGSPLVFELAPLQECLRQDNDGGHIWFEHGRLRTKSAGYEFASRLHRLALLTAS